MVRDMFGGLFKKPEPVVIGGLASVISLWLASYGLDLSEEQLAAIGSAIVAIITFVQRSRVSPVEAK